MKVSFKSTALFLALSASIFLPNAAYAQNAAPSPVISVKSTKSEASCSIQKASLGMTEEETLKILGEPTFKTKKKTIWHYRSGSNKARSKSDPQIAFKDGRIKSIIGTELKYGSKTLKAKNKTSEIEKALGPCPKLTKGAGDSVFIYSYPEHSLQIVTQKDEIMVFGIGMP